MKNMLKLINLFLLMFVFFNCNAPFDTINDKEPPSAGKVTVRIIVSDSLASERTIYPVLPVFSACRLSFTPLSGQTVMDDIKVPMTGNGIIKNIDLEEGEWKITAFGTIIFDDKEREIAEGSVKITAVPNTDIDATIILYSIPPDEVTEGTLSWTFTIPQGIYADTCIITISSWNHGIENNVEILENYEYDDSINTTDGDFTVSGSISLKSGYYLLRISAGTGREMAFYLEVVHIGAYRTTKFIAQASPDDFVPVLMLEGTVEIESFIINGDDMSQQISSIEVRAYSSHGEKIAFTTVNNNEWKIPIVKTETEREFRFRANLNFAGNNELEIKTDQSRFVYQADISGIEIKINNIFITLEGTLSINPDDLDVAGWIIKAYTNRLDLEGSTIASVTTRSNGKWTMFINAFDNSEFLFFGAEKIINNRKYKRIDIRHDIPVHNSHINNIILPIDFSFPEMVKVKGNFTNNNLQQLFSHNGRFSYTWVDLRDFTAYSFLPVADFHSEQGNRTIEYYYSNVVNNNSDIYFYGNSENDLIEWFNRNSKWHQDNVKIIIDFSNNEYFENGKPAVKIEKCNAILIESGEFYMGSPGDPLAPNGEKGRYGPTGLAGKTSETQHHVRLTSYYMMATTVTQGMYKKVMGINNLQYPEVKFINDEFPVVYISWLDAANFANKLSEMEGLTPFYNISGNIVTYTDWNSPGWRLPTEAEWEFAARAVNVIPASRDTNPFGIGNGKTLHTDIANYNGSVIDADFGYNPVPGLNRKVIMKADSFYPNAFGLYNMHGNVWEMCWDIFEGDYGDQDREDPTGHRHNAFYNNFGANTDAEKKEAISQQHRIIRGGSYYTPARFLRSAHRGIIAQGNDAYNDIGFRLVRRNVSP